MTQATTHRIVSKAFGLFAVLTSVLVFSQSMFSKIPTTEEILSFGGAQGTEFWIAIQPNDYIIQQAQALELYIASAYDTEIEVFDVGNNMKFRRQVKSYQILTLNTNNSTVNWGWEVREDETPIYKGIRITSQKPISVYVLNSRRFSSDGYLALPVSVWGTDYIATTYYDFKEYRDWPGGFIVLSRENGTEVTIDLRGVGTMDATTSKGSRINQNNPIVINLDMGQVFLVQGNGKTANTFDLTGSRIRSNKPIGLISYHQRTTMPNALINGNGRDHLVEMTPPVTAWGKKYVTVEYGRAANNPTGGKGDFYRVVSSQDNTRWTLMFYDKLTKQLIGQRGGYLAKAGDFQDIDQAPAPAILPYGTVVIEADKPIFVGQFANSSSFDGDDNLDPFMINVTPVEQFLKSTLYQTPTVALFNKHYLNLIVQADTTSPNMIDDLKSLQVDGIAVWNHPSSINPTLLFNKIPNTDLFWATIDYSTQARARRISCNGNVRFGGYIYGYGMWDSYGWPAAAAFRPTGYVDTLPPLLEFTEECGDRNYKATEKRNIPNPPVKPPVSDSDQVESGVAGILFEADPPSYNYEIVLLTDQGFPSDPSYKEFLFEVNVIDRTRDAFGVILVADFWGNITTDTLRYFAPKLVFDPTPLDFDRIRLKTSKELMLQVTNVGGDETVLNESRFKLGSYFSIVGGNQLPVTLGPGLQVTLTIRYTPVEETTDPELDWDIDTLFVKTNCAEFKLPMRGMGVVPRIVVEDWDAGTLSINENRCKQGGLLVRNPGTMALIITGLQGAAGSNFTVSNPLTPPLPITVPPRGQVYIKEICYSRPDVGDDEIEVVFNNNEAEGDSLSVWKGRTQTPGPNITPYDWRDRRVLTVHTGISHVYNTGNEVIYCTDVVFDHGTRYFPAGSNDANYVFKIVDVQHNGNPLPAGGAPLVGDASGTIGTDSVVVTLSFRPTTEQTYTVEIKPVFSSSAGSIPKAVIRGVGIIPQFATNPVVLTCAQTPEGANADASITIRNASATEALTISRIDFEASVNQTVFRWRNNNPPVVPVYVAPGATYTVGIDFRRPLADIAAYTARVEFDHDAVPGNGINDQIVPITSTEQISVGPCSTPDIQVSSYDFGRQRLSCDVAEGEIRITNTGTGNAPLEIKELRFINGDASPFTLLELRDRNGVIIGSLPHILASGEYMTVLFRFAPIIGPLPPTPDRNYIAQFQVLNTIPGRDELYADNVLFTLEGVGYTIPVQANLVNNMGPNQHRSPGEDVLFNVEGQGTFGGAGVTAFTADVIVYTESIAYKAGGLARGPGLDVTWTVSEPQVVALDNQRMIWRFQANGTTPLATDPGILFTFNSMLLLGANANFSDPLRSYQNLDISFNRECVIPTTTGDSTRILNCAISKRIVDVGRIQFSMGSVNPNPVNTSVATMDFAVGFRTRTTISILDQTGLTVATVTDDILDDGNYTLAIQTSTLASGVYSLVMQSGDFYKVQPFVIVK